MNNKKGFTLIELLAVIVILAIVAAVTMLVIVPKITESRESAAKSSVANMVSQIVGACQDMGVTDVMPTPAHGTFPTGTSYANCSNSTGCSSVSFSAAQLQAMNISGDMPSTFTASMTDCKITSGSVAFTAGQFNGMSFTITNGVVAKAS